MHLRLPLVAGIVALAAVTAGIRLFQHPAPAVLDVATSPVARASGETGFAVTVPAAARATRHGRRESPDRPAERGMRANFKNGIVVYVAGDVVRPGLYTLAPSARASDALHAAGGARGDADLVAVNLAATLADGDEVAVYPRGEIRAGARARRQRASASHGTRRRDAPHGRARKAHLGRRGALTGGSEGRESITPVDLNHADPSELTSLPGIGPALAERIVIVRETSGPFASLDDLLDVGGMTVSKVDAFAPFVTLR